MTRLMLAVPTALLLLLLTASAALADAQEPISGEGSYGAATDKVVTNTGFIVIAFFPLFILTMSLIQWRLDKRKDARKAAAKKLHAATAKGWESGW